MLYSVLCSCRTYKEGLDYKVISNDWPPLLLTDLERLGEGDLRLAPRLMSPLLGEAGRFTDNRLGACRLGFDHTGLIIVSSELGGVSFRPGRRFFKSPGVVRDWRGL